MSHAQPKIRGSNLPVLSEFNHKAVFETIRQNSGISRIEISRRTGLAAQTVSNITRDLLREKLVVESGVITGERGKPPVLLRLNPEGRFAFGVHLEPEHITVLLLNLAGNIVARYCPVAVPDAKKTTEAIADIIINAQKDHHIPEDRIGGVGVASPGPLNISTETIVNPPNLVGWRNYPIAAELRRMTGLPVVLEKDVSAACQGELWSSYSENQNFLFIYMGLGVGFGFVHNGEVYRGTSGNEGDLGHIVVEPDGQQCWCGKKGCLTVSADPRSIVTEASRIGLFQEPTHVHEPMETNDCDDIPQLEHCFDALCRRANSGEQACLDLMRRDGRRIGRLVCTLSDALDLDNIVLGGPYWGNLEGLFIDEIKQEVQENSVMRQEHRISVHSAKLGVDVAGIGAASIILNHDLSPRVHSLVFK
ncbi:ROK family transcriptional regulator [Bifidobacterium bombi]|uniref:ROK family protein n=1 Tax=Bifidobacterium bombi DSM 19703 TaxID=1341695 RepID=A0A080N6A5_9BIFI|nr:ROK family transcriptional regulator [Bifidobacterium bombi]KFF31429.1 ROK family protein [Bifidobacterium bombi DSM 19703]